MRVSAAVIVVLAWGALAFGAVSPWAYTPLMVACLAIGLYGLVSHARPDGSAERWLRFAFLSLLAASLIQLVPLPQAVVAELSPAADRLLRQFDRSYALSTSEIARSGSFQVEPRWHPLSINPRRTALGVGFLAAFGLFLGGLLRVFERVGTRRVVVGIVWLGGVLALVGIIQKALLGDSAYLGMRIYGLWEPENLLTTPFGPFVNKNHFAGWMVMALPLTLGYFIALLERSAHRRMTGWRDWFVWWSTAEGGSLLMVGFAAIVMGLALMLTNSRSGIGAFAGAVGIVTLLALRSLPSRGARLVVAGSLAVFFVTSLAWAGAEVVFRRFSDAPAGVQMRLDGWGDGVDIIRDFPIAGTGLNTYGTATLFYADSGHDRWFREAHNDYLQILAEGGLLVGIPVAVFIAVFVVAVRRRFGEEAWGHPSYWVRVGAVVGLCAIALQSLVEFSLQMPGNAALFVVLAAMALRRSP